MFIGATQLNAQNLSITSAATASFDENATGTVYTVEATSDQFSIFFSLGSGKDESFFSIEEISGELTFNNPPDFENAQDGNGDNVYEVEIIASDFFNSDESITLSITVNDVAEGGSALSITSGTTANFAENATGTVYTAEATSDQFSIFFSLGSGKDESFFSIEEISGLLTFNNPPDFEIAQDGNGDNVYEVEIIAADFTNPDASITVSITVTDVAENDNDPIITSNGGGATAAINVAENTTAVTTVTATDADAGSSITYAKSGTDAALFSLDTNTGVLIFTSAPDFEIPADDGGDNTYVVTVTASDGTRTDAQTITVTVTDVAENNSDPVITSDGGGATAAINVAENTTAVTTVTATDADAGSSITYSKSGTDAAFFTIGSGTGILTFTSAPDFESPADDGGDNTYVVTVTTSDGTRTDAQTITVTVTDVAENNSDPVITSNGGGATAAINVAENITAVTTVTATDADAGSSITFSKSGTDAAFFSLDANTGVLTFTSAPDFETPADDGANNTYVVSVTASDGTRTDAQTITVTVTAENDNDPIITSDGGGATAAINVAENTTAVTTVTATDADAGSSITFSKSGTDEAFFSLDANTGVLTFTSAPDFETPADDGRDNTYVVTVTASDGLRADAQTITVTVTDVSEVNPLSITSSTTTTFAENATGTVYTAEATSDQFSIFFSLGSGKDENLFSIEEISGLLTFNSSPNFENPQDGNTDNVYEVEIIASDFTNTDVSITLSITVTDVAENDNDPIITSNGGGATAAINVAENSTAVTTVTSTDADAGSSITYTKSGTDAALFSLDANTGVLTFTSAPDFEIPADDGADNTYVVTVTASDGSRTDAQTITVTVTDVQEADVTAPVFTSEIGALYNEGDLGTAYTATATDAGTVTFTLGNAKDEALFGIDNGGITFRTVPDFENPQDADQNNTYLLDVIATDDANNSSTKAIIIMVENINDNDPVITSNGAGATASVDVAENTTAVATVTATDADNLAALAFTITGGADQTLFEISSGALTFKSAPDFENPGDVGTDNMYEVIVTVSDTERTDSQTLTVTVTDTNDNAPVITSNGGGEVAFISIAENGTAVTTVTATDVDTNTSLSFSKAGTDGALFSINASTGVLTFISAPDFENPTYNGADNTYEVVVTVSDGTNSDTQNIAVTVTDVNDNSPVITSNGGGATAAINVPENSTAVTTVTATDADPTANLSYSKSGTDEALFSIDANTGVLTFITAPDFENPTDDGANNGYLVTVTVSDGNNTDTQDITVTVTDANDISPVISSNGGGATAAISVAENSTAVTTVTATDVDRNTSLSFSKSGTDADLFTIDANTGVLTFTAAPDFEAPTDNGADNSYELNVIASDGINTGLQAVTVTVTGLDDTSPVITSGTTATAPENSSGTAIYTITATDVDTDDSQLQFTVLGADADKFEVFETNKVRIKSPLDFEKKESAAGSNTFSIFIVAEDGINSFVAQEVTISLTDVNEAPGFVPSPSFTIDVNDNEPFELNVVTEDPDAGDQVKVSYLNRPDWTRVTEGIEEGVGAFGSGADNVSAIDFNSKGEYVYFSNFIGLREIGNIFGGLRDDITTTSFTITKVGTTGSQTINGLEASMFDQNGQVVSQDDVSFDRIKWGASPLFLGNEYSHFYDDIYRDVVYTENDEVFIIDANTIRKLDFTTERMTLFAGASGKVFLKEAPSGDVTGSLLDARFDNLNSIVSDKAGNLYVSDRGNKKIKKIDVSSGQVTNFGAAGTFTDPTRMAIDANDNLFVLDGFTIKKITPNGTVSDFIGNGTESYAANNTSIGKVVDMHFDKDNSLWIMEDDTETEGLETRTGNNRIIRKIDVNGTSTVIIKNEIEDINQHIPQRGKFDETSLGRLAAITYNSNADRMVYSENSVQLISNAPVNNSHALNQIVISRPESISASPTIPVGTYTVTARAEDLGGLTKDQVYTVNVLDKTAPVINSAAKRSFRENTTGEVYAVTVEASNNPSETLTYAFAGGVDDFRFSISASTGKILLQSPKDFENPDDQGADRTYDLKVQAVDNAGNASAIKDIRLILTNKNENPEFTSDPDPEYLTVKDTETYSYPFTTTDIDGDKVTVTGTNLPDWLKIEKENNGEATRFARLPSIFGIHLRQDSKGNLWTMSRKWLSKISPNGDVDQIFTLGSNTRILVEGVTLTIRDIYAFAINSRDEVHLFALAFQGNTSVAALVILRLDQNNQWIHVAGALNTTTTEEKDGNPKETSITAGFGGLTGMVFDTQDQLYFTSRNSIRKIANNQVTTVAGQLNAPPGINPSTDGDAASAFVSPNALAVAQDGTVYFSEVFQEKVRKVSPQGVVSTLLTTDDGMRLPFGLFLFEEQQLYIAGRGSGFFAISETTSVNKYSLVDNSLTKVFSSASFSQNHDIESTNLNDAEFSNITELIVLSEDEFIILDSDVIRKINGKTNPDRVTGNAIGKAGTYDIRLQASDGLGGLAEQRYTLTVEDVTAPEINPGAFRFEENFIGEIPFQLTGSDNVTEAENLRFNTFSVGGDNQFFEVSTDGKISVKTAQNKEAPSDVNQDGIYELLVSVQDEADNWGFALITLELSNKNEAPAFTTEPSAESLIVKDNETFTYAYQTTDPEEDPVTVNGTLPAWLSLQKGSTGALEEIHSGINTMFQKGDFGFDGNYYSIPGFWGNRVFQTTSDGTSSPFATDGSGVYGWIDGDKSAAQFSILFDIRATPDRKALILSDYNRAFRKIDLVTNQVSTLFQWSDPQRPNYVNLTGNADDWVSNFRIKENGNLVFSIGPALTDIYETTPSGQVVNITQGVFSSGSGIFLPFNDGSYYAVDYPSGPDRSRSVVRWQNGVPSALAILPANFDLNDWIIDGTDVLIAGEDLTNERNIILRLTADGTLSTEHDWRLDYQGLNMGSLEDAKTESASPRRFMRDQNGTLVVSNYPASVQNTNSRILRIDGTNVPAGVNGSAVDQVGTHEVTLTAADVPFDLKTEQKFTITVVDATAPVFTSANTTAVPENSTDTFFSLKASDTNSKAVFTYSIVGGADAARFKVTTENGEGKLAAVAALNFEAPNDANQNGVYEITVSVSDGVNSTSQDLLITLANRNDAPEITSDPVTEVNDNETYNYPFTTADEDGDNVTVNGSDIPDWLQLNNEGGATVSSIAGGSETPGADGTGTDASMSVILDMVTQDNNDFYFNEFGARSIRKFNLQGEVTTLAGDESQPIGDQDGTGKNARFTQISHITFGPDGNLYVSDDNKIKKITLAGEVTTYAGRGSKLIDETQNLSDLKFSGLGALVFDSKGNLFAVEGGSLLVKIEPDGTVSKFAGDTEQGYQDGAGLNARFKSIWKLLIDSEDNIFLTDLGDYRVRKITNGGEVSTVAGSGVQGFEDGSSTTAQFTGPSGLALDSEGNLLISEGGGIFGGSKVGIRKIDKDANVTTSFIKDQNPGNVGLTDGGLSQATMSFFYDFVLVGSDIIFGDANRIRRISGDVSTAGLTGDPTGKVGTYNIKLTPNDGTVNGEVQEFTLTVKDATAPTIADIDALSFAENNTSTVVDVNATDTNPNAQITYSLGITKDEATFNINANTGVISFATAPDFESPADANGDNTYLLDVKASDGINESTVAVQVTVTNVNESPTDLTIATAFNENVVSGQGLSTMVSTDEDAADTFTYSLVSGNGDTDNTSFEVNGTTLSTKVDFDFESQVSYNIRLRTTDAGGLTFDKTFVLTINDLNEAPTDIALDNAAIDENNAVDDAIGNLSSKDEDASETHTYTLVSGEGDTDNASFDIADGGLVAKSIFNFESKTSYSVRVRTTDKGGLTFDKVFTITINDLNEAPTDIVLGLSAIDENNAINDPVTLFATTDADASDTHTYSLVAGEGDTDNASFETLNGGLLAKEVFDFETKSSYSVRIKTTDEAGLSFEKSVTITINNVEEAPTDITLDNASIAENNAADAAIGSFTTTDDDNGETFTYSLVAGDGDVDNDDFTITGAELTVNSVLDFETKSSYIIRVRSTDGAGLTFEKVFTISVTDVPEPIIRVVHTNPAEPAPLGLTFTFGMEVFNDGDGPLEISNIAYPDGFSGASSMSEIAAGNSAILTVSFIPQEVRTYSGDIVLTYNGGMENVAVSAQGAIITALENNRVDPAKVTIYPNPTDREFTIDLTEFDGRPVDLKIASPSGVQMIAIQQIRKSSYTIDVRSYAQGIYMIALSTAEQTIVKKLMIRR
ncbi:hypothetical protein BFP71_11055 [Roseivirga misakiensis]|uniref:Cadherin domain-containing protein n=1 Tax=Roseivirga misakiensis TaxID=1563681 RepID=A0A1E5SYA9_9BACT|nr:hypothetical protein BFP71_11055 [Roseivirga misakiensis]